jgi:hypothetical protein
MADQNTNSEAPAKSSLLPKILISGFLTTIVVAETFIFFFMVPSADDVAALAEARLIEKVEASMAADGEDVIDDEDAIKEFQLGEYGIVFVPPGSDRSHRVEFHLFGTVKSKDEKRLEELFTARQGRFRHRMILEVRNATMDELTENQLGLIQRRILATSNEILEEPILLGIGFNNYQLIEE